MTRERRKPKTKGLLAVLDEVREAMKPFWDGRRAVEEAECPARVEKLRQMHVNIDCAGGNCPVQIEGHVKGKPFYFRARGEHWSLGIGADPVGNPDWYYEEEYGSWPEAGWMPLHEAYDFLIAGILKWRPKLAQGMSAGTAETHSGSGPQDRQPGPEGMRPETPTALAVPNPSRAAKDNARATEGGQ